MASFLKNVFGGSGSTASPVPSSGDADFADFAGAPDPSPLPGSLPSTSVFPPSASSTPALQIPYTKWYRVWERSSPSDFYTEAMILPFLLLLVFVQVWGSRTNRRRAQGWIKAHAPALRTEFALVGFSGRVSPTFQTEDEIKHADELLDLDKMIKEKAKNEYISYATGRQNIAFMDIKLTFKRRYNPMAHLAETGLSFFFDSFASPAERMETTMYAFDGRENDLLPPSLEGPEKNKIANSTYDGFVWAVVHKDLMQRLRDERYDLSLTSTKEHPKLPAWVSIMTESAEITDALLTPELIKAIEFAGDGFEALVITDMPMDQPKKLNELTPKKRLNLSLRLPSSAEDYKSTLPIFQTFLRIPDQLVNTGRFRPEAMRRVRQTRDQEMQKIKKVDETEKAEERKLKGDKERKEKRDILLKNMSADEQRKYLEKEREKDIRKSQKRKTMRA